MALSKTRALVNYEIKTPVGGGFVSRHPVGKIVNLADVYIWPDGSVSQTFCADGQGKVFCASQKLDASNEIEFRLIR